MKLNINLAKLGDGLDESPTVMVRDKQDNKGVKIEARLELYQGIENNRPYVFLVPRNLKKLPTSLINTQFQMFCM